MRSAEKIYGFFRKLCRSFDFQHMERAEGEKRDRHGMDNLDSRGSDLDLESGGLRVRKMELETLVRMENM